MEYLTVNKICMTVLGHWPYRSQLFNRVIRIVSIISGLSLFIPVITALYQARNYFDDFVVCVPMNVTGVLFYICYIFLIVKTPAMLVLLNRISQDFKELQPFETEIGILRKSAGEGRFAALTYIIYTNLSASLFCAAALLPQILDIILPLNETRPKSYIIEVEYIFFDKDDHYYFIYLQSLIIGSFVIFTITTCDIMFYSFIQHACGMYRVLCYRLQNVKVKNCDNQKMYKKAVDCVLMHINLLKYIEDIDSCFSTFFLFTCGCVIMLMSFQGAMIIVKIDDLEFVMRYSTYYFGQVIHLFYNCIAGQILIDHNNNFIDNINYSNWYVMPTKIRKVLLLMMIRSFRESKVTIGKLFTLSMETYSSIMKTIFSFLSVLTSMRN